MTELVEDLIPFSLRHIFHFSCFNRMQSILFRQVVGTNDNLVISSPTGSGKTVIHELSIIRLLLHGEKALTNVKCVFIAPNKALCQQRFREWEEKFASLGLL